MVRVPKKAFAEFKRACKYWIDIFGLKGWEIYFEFGNADNDAYAECEYDYKTKTATLRLTNECESRQELNELQPDKRAFHEVCHLLLSGLDEMVNSKIRISKVDLNTEVHNVIRTLENAIYAYYEEN
jgi:hypothetical protein